MASKVHDHRGRFKAGNQYAVRKTDTAIIPHPLFPGRDTQGHMLPKSYACKELDEIRQELLNSLTAERVELMTRKLFELVGLCGPEDCARRSNAGVFVLHGPAVSESGSAESHQSP